jgi:hypothetical protein
MSSDQERMKAKAAAVLAARRLGTKKAVVPKDQQKPRQSTKGAG